MRTSHTYRVEIDNHWRDVTRAQADQAEADGGKVWMCPVSRVIYVGIVPNDEGAE